MGVKESNQWSQDYFTAYCIDTFMYEIFLNFIKISLLRSELL